MSRLQLRPGFATLAAVLLLAGCNPTGPAGNDGGGGGDGGGPTTICTGNSDCPASKPVCSGGVCVAKNPTGCTTDADCDGGTCNTMTGKCTSGSPGTDGGPGDGGGGTACTTANDCPVNQICKQGTCQPFDPNAVCTSNADCPRDHVCNTLGGTCQGCLNDNSCVSSPNGPKCDTGSSSGGPGAGYCFKECGPGTNLTCPSGDNCDTSKGGLCVPACSGNADCTGGMVCHGGQCQACTADTQCDTGMICNTSGVCVNKPSCTDASCQNLGQAYYCDSGSNTCQLGCTPSGCSGATKDCNPCTAPQTCDTTTHQCSGGSTCNCASLGCTSTQTCDTTTCTCVTAGGGGNGGGAIGDPCLQDSDCAQQSGMKIGCWGAIASIGIKGTCQEICDQSTLCLCSGTKQCINNGTVVFCAFGGVGECQ